MARDKDSIRHEYIALMQAVRKAWTAQADRALEEAGLSLSTGMCFRSIARTGEGARQITLAEDMGIKAPTLVRQLDILEDNGWITRRDEKGDRRTRLVYFTREGKMVAAKIDKILNDLARKMMDGIPAADIAQASRVFAAIVDNASQP